MKRTIRLNESELKRMISESVRRVLKETGFLSEGNFVNNKPIDWNKISDDDVDTVIKKRSDRHYNRPNGGDVLARRQKQLDAAKILGMEGDELDVFPDTVQARTEFYRNHPWMKPYRDTYVFPSHMKKKNELQSTEGGEGFQYLSNPSSLPAGWQ